MPMHLMCSPGEWVAFPHGLDKLISDRITSDGPRRPDISSRVSIAPPTTEADARSEVFYCQECGAKYTGQYGKGNLGRHRRHKHDGEIVELPCEDNYCSKVFRRRDARLKHYRHDHPNLNPAPAM